MPNRPRVPLAIRIHSFINKSGPIPPIDGWSLGPCWIWTGGLSTHDRPKIGVRIEQPDGSAKYSMMLVTRVLWTIERGPIPEDNQVLHKCDVSICCNLDHMYLGNYNLNAEDRSSRGRHHARIGRPITKELVLQIRNRYDSGGITQTALAREIGISPQQVNYIVNRKQWIHV